MTLAADFAALERGARKRGFGKASPPSIAAPTSGRVSSFVVHEGDALAIVLTLATGSIACQFHDPPYSSGGFTRGDRMSDPATKYLQNNSSNRAIRSFSGDNRDAHALEYWHALWLAQAYRVGEPGSVCGLCCDWRTLTPASNALQSGGWVQRGVIVWSKPPGSYRPQRGRFAASTEFVVWGSKGAMPQDGPCLRGNFEISSPRSRQHVTEKPVDLFVELLKVCRPGGKVLDLFAGVGTSGVAALRLGLDWIGAELDPSHAQTARHRCTEAQGVSL